MSKYRYKAFISYAHADRKWVRWLHRSLEKYRVPKHLVGKQTARGPVPERLTPIFRDRDELPTAADLGAVLEQALRDSESLIVVCSPTAAQSRWVNEEIRYFRSIGRADRIFCLIVDGEPGGSTDSGGADECFPAMLHAPLNDGDAETATERVAADARPGGDGKQGARLKIISGMLGLGLDELRQREQQRRQQRLMAIAAVAVIGMVITTGLAAAALMARAEAERQRVRAEQQAETARQTSDFLVELFNVVDPGEARGREPLAREILDRGAEKIERELSDQPAVKANLLGTMGKVYTGLGLYDQAADLLEAALATGKQVDNQLSGSDVGNLTALAEVHYRNARYDEAAAPAEAAVLTARSGDNEKELHDALLIRAQVLMATDELEGAKILLQEALTIRADSDAALNSLGELNYYLQDYAAARGNFELALAGRERILGEDHPATIEVLSNVASLAYKQRDFSSAIELQEETLRRARIVFGDSHPDTATYMNNLGRTLIETGRPKAADALIRQSVAVDRKRIHESHEYLVFSLNNLALIESLAGNEIEAMRLYEEAISISQQRKHYMHGPILVNLADLMCSNEKSEGLGVIRQAKKLFAEQPPHDAWRQDYADSVHGDCLRLQGDMAGAEPLLRESQEALVALAGRRWLFADRAIERWQSFNNIHNVE